MPATFIQSTFSTDANYATGTVTFASPTPVGALVIVCIGGWQSSSIYAGPYGVGGNQDNLGNDYVFIPQDATAFTSATIAYSYITHAGTISLRLNAGVTGFAATPMQITMRQYAFPNAKYDQSEGQIGWYGAAGGAGRNGRGTGQYNIADSLIISVIKIASNTSPFGGGPPLAKPLFADPSPSGDTLVFELAGNVGTTTVYERNATGPGTTRFLTEWFSSDCYFGEPVSSVSAVFSLPLTRPGGLAKQFAARPGRSKILGVFNGQNEVYTSLPYMPQLGNLVVIGVGVGNYFGNSYTFSVTDDYGNVYTEQANCPASAGSPDGGAQCAMFTSQILNLPSSGLFQVKLTLSEPTNSFDDSAIIAAEYDLTPVSFSGGIYATRALSSGDEGIIETVSLNANGLLVSFTFNQQFFGNLLAIWSPEAGYTVESELTLPIPDIGAYSQAQESRMGCAAMSDKTEAVVAPYNAEITSEPFSADSFAMAILAVVSGNTITIPFNLVIDEAPLFPPISNPVECEYQ